MIHSEALYALFASIFIRALLTNHSIGVRITVSTSLFIFSKVTNFAGIALVRSSYLATVTVCNQTSGIDAFVLNLVQPKFRGALFTLRWVIDTLATFFYITSSISFTFFCGLIKIKPINAAITAI